MVGPVAFIRASKVSRNEFNKILQVELVLEVRRNDEAKHSQDGFERPQPLRVEETGISQFNGRESCPFGQAASRLFVQCVISGDSQHGPSTLLGHSIALLI